jgi:hypothetical protein
MPRGYRNAIFAVVGIVLISLLAAAIAYAILKPEPPKFAGEEGYQEISRTYQAGDPGCQPSALKSLKPKQAERRKYACADAAEQHRFNANNLIEYRRAADAADASARFSYQQTRITVVGALLGIMTMAAAIIAAVFAGMAAYETNRGANAAENALEETDRPHMLLTEMKIDGLQLLPREEQLNLTYKFINHGKGPAWMQKVGVYLVLCDIGEVVEIDDTSIVLNATNWTIAPDNWYGTTKPTVVTVPVEKQNSVIAGTTDLFVIIWITYLDSGKRLHEHRIVMQYQTINDRLIPVNSPYWRYT